ncbi:MAG TPA: LuxR family transcriptional regulator [Candidatus Copromorpha excrementipullorum]|uniref:LuxR family transcriptional regulator n=2 Tax=Eubacteriaceae TaxID=186806 RepID=A0A9D1N664_9FIRM|nr:LuxR family transcriptional regulator [Candidatus Copromorpha excrementipullorum]
MILRMNSESDILKALNTFLTDIEGLVPYEKACIYFYDLSAPEIVKDYIGQGFSEKELIDYERYYCNIDDVVEKMMPNKEVVIKSSEAFDINKRKETEYFIDYVTPAKTKVSLDTNFRWNMENRGFCIGSLDLFRNEKDVDFSEREVEICRIFQPHIELKASNYAFLFENLTHKYSLTNAEQDVATMILKGYSNEQIAEEKCISISTVKKHVSRILEKSDTKSRIEFICKATGKDK